VGDRPEIEVMSYEESVAAALRSVQ